MSWYLRGRSELQPSPLICSACFKAEVNFWNSEIVWWAELDTNMIVHLEYNDRMILMKYLLIDPLTVMK